MDFEDIKNIKYLESYKLNNFFKSLLDILLLQSTIKLPLHITETFINNNFRYLIFMIPNYITISGNFCNYCNNLRYINITNDEIYIEKQIEFIECNELQCIKNPYRFHINTRFIYIPMLKLSL